MGLHSGEQITTEARFREILAVNNQYGLMLLEINKNAG